MRWGYGAEQGHRKKWADKYGIKIDVVQINDYIESINQCTAGQFDGCTMTNRSRRPTGVNSDSKTGGWRNYLQTNGA